MNNTHGAFKDAQSKCTNKNRLGMLIHKIWESEQAKPLLSWRPCLQFRKAESEREKEEKKREWKKERQKQHPERWHWAKRVGCVGVGHFRQTLAVPCVPTWGGVWVGEHHCSAVLCSVATAQHSTAQHSRAHIWREARAASWLPTLCRVTSAAAVANATDQRSPGSRCQLL